MWEDGRAEGGTDEQMSAEKQNPLSWILWLNCSTIYIWQIWYCQRGKVDIICRLSDSGLPHLATITLASLVLSYVSLFYLHFYSLVTSYPRWHFTTSLLTISTDTTPNWETMSTAWVISRIYSINELWRCVVMTLSTVSPAAKCVHWFPLCSNKICRC